MAKACGTPREKPRVRAFWRGKLMLASGHAPILADHCLTDEPIILGFATLATG